MKGEKLTFASRETDRATARPRALLLKRGQNVSFSWMYVNSTDRHPTLLLKPTNKGDAGEFGENRAQKLRRHKQHRHIEIDIDCQ